VWNPIGAAAAMSHGRLVRWHASRHGAGTLALRTNSRDVELLASLAEHHALTIQHLCSLHQRNAPALRRRLRALALAGLVQSTTLSLTARAGRPEGIYTLTEEGTRLLEKEGALGDVASLSDKALEEIGDLGHLLLLNDFRVQLALVERIVPDLDVQFLSSGPGVNADKESFIHERFRGRDGTNEWIEFTPDGVFSISHTPTGRALLFILEVDMGTETLVSRRRPKQDVRQKIVNYHAYFRCERCQRYGSILGSHFRGFRVLFVASTSARHGALCRLVRRMPPCDFIWLTDRDSMQSEGVWSTIWVRGGCSDQPPGSIVGGQIPSPCPSPADIS